MFARLHRTLAFTAAIAGSCVPFTPAAAGDSSAAPASYPLYCQGRIDRNVFTWTTTLAKNVGPGPAQCSWPDRLARGEEIHANPRGDFGMLCPAPAFDRAFSQFGAGDDFIVSVASVPGSDNHHQACLTPTAAPIALTPENRPWPIAKNPADGPKQANTH